MHLLIKQEIANLTIQDVKNILYGVRGGWVGTGMEVKASLGYLMWATFVQYLHETISNTYH